MANRLPLVFDPTNSKIKELPAGDNLSLTNSSIVDAVNINASGTIVANTLTVQNLNAAGGSIAAVALSNNYDDLDNLPTLFSGDYNDLTNKPTAISSDWADITNKPVIATSLSQLINDTNFVTNSQIAITANQVVDISTVGKTNNYNDLSNKPDLSVYVRTADLVGGTLTVEVNNTGDLIGSVFAEDSTLLVDHHNGTINLSGGPISLARDVGSQFTRFRNLYLSSTIDIEGSFIGRGAKLTVSVTGLALKPTGEAIGLLLEEREVLQNEYNSLFQQWLGIPPFPPNLRDQFFSTALVPKQAEIDEVNSKISSRAIVSFEPNSSRIVADQVFNGNFEGAFIGSVFADDSSILIDGITGTHLGRFDGDLTGSVFGDDSTLIVDGANKTINATNVYATTHWGNLSKNGSILSITGDAGIQLLPAGVFNIPNATNIDIDATGTIDITATDNLTISSTSGTVSISGHISIASLQTLVAASTDFTDFKSRIAALTP
jgi:hypothetical protein